MSLQTEIVFQAPRYLHRTISTSSNTVPSVTNLNYISSGLKLNDHYRSATSVITGVEKRLEKMLLQDQEYAATKLQGSVTTSPKVCLHSSTNNATTNPFFLRKSAITSLQYNISVLRF